MKKYITNKFMKLSLIVGIVAILGTSCTEEIDLDLDTTYNHLVVDGAITTDTTSHRVVLSRSGDPLNKLPIKYILNATVSITDGTNTFMLSEKITNSGIYETDSNVFGIPGKTYTLNISNVDINEDGAMETYSASSMLKAMLTVDSIKIMYQKFSKDEFGYMVNLYGWDIGGRNYYLTKVEKNGVLLTDSIKEYGKAINDGFAGEYYPGLSVYYLSNNKPDEKLNDGDTITLVLNMITEDYYKFIDGFQQEYQPKVPIFSGPSSNVITNIEPKNMSAGYFAAYAIERKSTIFNQKVAMGLK